MGTGEKRIGTYLVENGACGQVDVEHALEVQSKLEQSGQYKATGEIMIEHGRLVPMELKKGLQRQYVDILSESELFKSFSTPMLLKVAQVADDRVLKKKSIVFEQGDPGNTFFMIVSGRVRVYRVAGSGLETTLAHLSAGDGFGEMALLTGEPRSASVQALENTRLLIINKNDFDKVVAANPVMSVAFAKNLAERLYVGNISLDRASATEQAYQRFVSEYQAGPHLDLVGESSVIRKLRLRIAEIAETDQPVLIIGPAGTEKKDISWQIHKHNPGMESPFLVVDAKTASLGGQTVMRETDAVNRELAQGSALFGHRQGSLPFANHDRLGLLEVGRNGTVVIDNAEYLTRAIQAKLVAYLTTGCFEPLGGNQTISAAARIILTASPDSEDSPKPANLSDELYALVESSMIEVAPLRRHKKDLRVIVDYLVDHYAFLADKKITEIARDSYEEILAYDWPGNMDELEVVIKRGVNLARDGRLTPEDLFIGRIPATGKYTLNLLKSDWLRRLLGSRYYPAAGQAVTAVIFLVIFFLGFFGDQNPDRNISLVLTWGLWEPVAFLFAVLLGRLWCGLCPIGALSSFLSNNLGLKLKVPAFIRKYGLYLSGLGLLAVYWAEVASQMVFSPYGTAMLLAVITLSAIIVGLLFQRRVWCKHLCPLGRFLGILSSCSMMEMRANYAICNNECFDHACYIGDYDQAPGCPMFEGPFALRSNIDCILCGNCLKNCQNLSPRLNLRLPAYELWSGGHRPEPVVAFLVPLVMATQLFRAVEEAGYFEPLLHQFGNRWLFFGLALTVITALTILYFKVSSKVIVSKSEGEDSDGKGVLANAMLFLAAGFELGFHGERFLVLTGRFFQVLGHQLGLSWELPVATVSPWGTRSLQVFLICVGTLAALAALKKMLQNKSKEETKAVPFLRFPILIPALFYIWLFLAG